MLFESNPLGPIKCFADTDVDVNQLLSDVSELVTLTLGDSSSELETATSIADSQCAEDEEIDIETLALEANEIDTEFEVLIIEKIVKNPITKSLFKDGNDVVYFPWHNEECIRLINCSRADAKKIFDYDEVQNSLYRP